MFIITISITFISFPLKIWENYVEGQENTNGPSAGSKEKEVLKVDFFLNWGMVDIIMKIQFYL